MSDRVRSKRWIWWIVGAVIVVGLIGSMSERDARPVAIDAPAADTRPTGPALALLSVRGSDEGNYHVIEGEVKNLTADRLEHVVAVGSWYTADDTLVTSDTAIVEFDPILPGQTSPFKTMSRTNPAMSKFRVVFKEFSGGTIETRDDRK